jgi:soluble P-type ATPase
MYLLLKKQKMIKINIPGYKTIEARHLVLDYNGTLAIDGKMIDGVKPLLEELSKHLTIHVITADTFGTVDNELMGLDCRNHILDASIQDIQKEMYVIELGKQNVIVIGNGRNDILMMREASLSIMVIQQEGAYSRLAEYCDIACFSIIDALNLILNPLRIIATLRK